MAQYEQSRTMNASPDQVLGFVKKIENLPQYVPTMDAAQSEAPERVRAQGEAQGHPYNQDGYFRIDEDARRLEWGSDEPNRYDGWMTVEEEGVGSRVTLHVAFGEQSYAPETPRQESPQPEDKDPLEEAVETCLTSIQNFVEGEGGKVEPTAAT